MKENENSKKELNEKDTQNVSGGFTRNNDNGVFINEDGKRYNLYCDYCNRKIKDRGAFSTPKGKHACIRCYEKLHKTDDEWFEGYPHSLIDDELAY